MPITTYDPNNSLSRFQSSKNWNKLLFRADKKLQTTEIEEIQDIIYNQISKVYSSLYDFYTITRGCKIIVTRIVATGYECILTDGQVFLQLFQEGGYFIDTPSFTFTLSRDEITEVGLSFNVNRAYDLDDYKNPHTGGAAFGSEGSDRLLITATPIISTASNPFTPGFYPIAIIKPKTPSFISQVNDIGDGYPDIVYYRNEELTQIFNQRILSTYIKKLIELRLYELAGNFIGEGMYLTVATYNSAVCYIIISPGVAYINGVRIESNYPYKFKVNLTEDINNPLVIGNQYLFYLTEKGTFEVKSTSSIDTNLIDVPPSSLALGYILLENRIGLTLNYKIIEAQTRMPDIAQIRNLQESNEENNKQLAYLALEADLLGLTSNSINEKLNGIFIDSFTDLNNSDIFFPEFKASILPAIQAISLPFISYLRDNRTFTIDQEASNIIVESILNENNELVPYWSTISGTQTSLFNIERNITGSFSVPVYTSNSINVRTSPSIIYKSDENTFINYSHPDVKFLTGLDTPVIIDTPFNDNTYNRAVTVYASGFPSEQDNIIVQLNNVILSSLEVVKGELGSSFGSVKSDQAGNLTFNFTIPEIEKAEVYTLSLSFGSIEAASDIVIKDPEIERTNREITSNFIDNLTPKFSSSDGGLSQSFNIVSPVMITAIQCTIMDFPEILTGDILNVYITKADSLNRPTKEAIGYGSINLTNVPIISQDRPIPSISTINLNKPVNLTRGSYCIVFQSAINGIELGVSTNSLSRLIDGRTFTSLPEINSTYINNSGTWIKASSFDSIDFNLVLHKPISLLSSTILDIVNPIGQEFDILDMNISIENDNNSFISIYVQDENQQYKLIENGSFFFRNPVLSTKVRIDITGTNNTHPILNLDNISFNLLSTQEQAIWISRNQQYDSPYSNLSFSVDVYKPDSATYRFFFSSNQGQTWEELNDQNSTLLKEVVNDSLPVTKYTFLKENLGFVVLNNEENQRYNLRYKIEIDMDNLEGLYPFFKNIVSITNFN